MEKPRIKSYLLDVTSLNEESFNRLLKSVKQYRRDKISKLSLDQHKYLSLAVELLIKKGCEDFGISYLDEEIVIDKYGKPSFKNSKYYFNTSHSGNYAFCVFSDVEVGCDIEEIKEYKERVANRFFTAKERSYIDLNNDKNGTFYKIWTLKESYVKCIGKGLNLPINSFELISKEQDIVIKDNPNYQFIEFIHETYQLSICLKTSLKDKEKYKHKTVLVKL